MAEDRDPTGVTIKVQFADRLKLANSDHQQIYVEIRNQTNMIESEKKSLIRNSSRSTKEVSGGKPQWNESFFYNTSEMTDDNITFILRLSTGKQLGKDTLRSLSLLARDRKDPQLKQILKLKDINDLEAAYLHVTLDFYEGQNIIGGVEMPDLNLVPKKPVLAQTNLIDNYKTPKLNCYSFMDDDKIPGFDKLEFFPNKYKLANEPVKPQ